MDPELRWALITGLARLGRAGDRIETELARDNTISGKEHAAAARAIRPTAEAKAAAWDAAVVQTDTPNETQRSIVLAFQAHGQDAVLEPYVDKYLESAETMWEHLGTHKASVALNFLFPRPLASPALLERVDAWLATTTANPAAVRFVKEGRADVARYLAAQAKDADGR
jgi:aminopeptidase N